MRPRSTRSAGAQYAELVTFWISEDDPGLRSLTYIGPRGTESEHARNLAVLIVRPQIEMETVLDGLRLGNRHEEQPW